MSQEEFARYFVAGISRTITGDDLRVHFSQFGNVIESRVHKDSNGLSMGYGWVGFDRPVPTVLQHVHQINGQTLDVQLPRNQAKGPNKVVQPPLVIPQKPQNLKEKEIPRKRSRSPVERRRSHSHRRRSASRDRSRREVVNKPPPPPSAPQQQQQQQPGRFPQMSQSFPPPPPPQMAPAPPLGSIDAMTEMLVCIPYSLCPPQYARDPRVIIARLDASGALIPVPSSFAPAPLVVPQGPAHGQIPQGQRPAYY